jgi:hypothetical protein
MRSLRWALILLFCAAVDFANPLAAMALESHESAEEAVHLGGQRRTARLAAVVRHPSAVRPDDAVRAAHRRSHLRTGSRPRTAPDSPVLKQPSPVPDSPSSPEDH